MLVESSMPGLDYLPGKATVPFDDGVLDCDLSILEMVPDVEGDPLGVVVVQVLHVGGLGRHCVGWMWK